MRNAREFKFFKNKYSVNLRKIVKNDKFEKIFTKYIKNLYSITDVDRQ